MNKNTIIVALLVVALAVVLIMWMNDRDSVDPSIDVDIGMGDAPAFVRPA